MLFRSLVCGQSRGHRAAVGPYRESLSIELPEIAADRHRGDLKLLLEVGDRTPTPDTQVLGYRTPANLWQ